MNHQQYEPLKYPRVWPPPDLPPPSPESREVKLRRIPLLGRFLSGLLSHFRWLRHLSETLEPIETEILEQLEARPRTVDWFLNESWFETSRKQQLAQAFSRAMESEKGLDEPPPLHPDDPFELLLWGAHDDLTWLTAALEIRQELHCLIPREGFQLSQEQNWTLKDYLAYCDQYITQESEGIN